MLHGALVRHSGRSGLRSPALSQRTPTARRSCGRRVRCRSVSALASARQQPTGHRLPVRWGDSTVRAFGSSGAASQDVSGENVDALLQEFARGSQTSVPLKNLLVFGTNPTENTLLRAGKFLHNELPVRLAKRAVELESLPLGLSDMPSVMLVRRWYVQSFLELINMPAPSSFEEERKLTKLLRVIFERHSGVLWTMARGVHELKAQRLTKEQHLAPRFTLEQTFPEVQAFLDSFYLSRIGIRVLIGQHIALHEEIEGWVGLICERTSPAEIARHAVNSASKVCQMTYGRAPRVTMAGQLDHTFPYVPSHLHHMLVELLKNSMRAVVEHHADEKHLPDIRVIIGDGERNDDVCIKVSDEGGGIPRREVDDIWSYMYTTADTDAHTLFEGFRPEVARDFGDEGPMAGLGYGLPISRLFARYFGGDIQVISLEGFGTDAYIHMRCLGDSEEPLP